MTEILRKELGALQRQVSQSKNFSFPLNNFE
jgi:hypothetical protein